MTEVRIVESMGEREDAYAVRQTVFVDEQGVDEELEYDEYEETATHFVAYDGDEPIGAARLREPEPGLGKVERVAVLEPRREQGVGESLMEAVEAEAREGGMTKLKLHSQTRAMRFYASVGFERRGEEFEEAGIPHVKMYKPIE